MLLYQWKSISAPVHVSWGKAVARCMCTSVDTVAKHSQKEAYIKQMLANQSEALEKPAGWDQAKPFNQLPGPKPMPIVGNLWRFMPRIGTFYGLDQLSLHSSFYENFGKIMILSGLQIRNDVVFLFDPDDIEMCYRNEGVWPHREALESLNYYKEHVREDIFQGQTGVLTAQGEKWYHARTAVNPPMLQPRSAQMYIGTMDDVAQDFVERIRVLESNHPQGTMPDDFSNELNKWALESICTIALNKRLGLLNPNFSPAAESQQFIDDVLDVFHLLNELDVKPSLWKLYSTRTWRKYIKFLNRMTDFELKHINEAIRKMENNKEDKSPAEMSILEQLLKRDKKVAFAMVFDMLSAGIDTTSRTTAAAIYFLSKNQEVQERLREECRNVLPHKDSPITKEVLNNIPYLKAVIKETTRLAPIAIGNNRTSPKDMVLSGYQIPKGTNLLCSHLYLCRQEKYYLRANEFIPERWLRQSAEEYQAKDAHPFVFMPFGFGPRSCVGKRLAQLEMEVLLAKIIRNFSLSWPHEDMQWVMNLVYGVGSPLKYNMKSLED